MTKAKKVKNRTSKSPSDFLKETDDGNRATPKPYSSKGERKQMRNQNENTLSEKEILLALHKQTTERLAALEAKAAQTQAGSSSSQTKRKLVSSDAENPSRKKTNRNDSDSEIIVDSGSDIDSDCNDDNAGYVSAGSRKSRRRSNKSGPTNEASGQSSDPLTQVSASTSQQAEKTVGKKQAKAAKQQEIAAKVRNQIAAVRASAKETTSNKDVIGGLIVTGLNQDIASNQIKVIQHLKLDRTDFKKVIPLSSGKVLIFPSSNEAKDKIVKSSPDGVTIKPSVKRPPKKNDGLSIVLLRVHPSITDEELENELKIKAKRLIAAKTNTPTWKVRLQCESPEQKNQLLGKGVFIAGLRYKAEEYKSAERPLQCFKCGELGHMSYNCVKTDKCLKCAGPHSTKGCTEDTVKKCSNCGGDHTANSHECPLIKQAKLEAATKVQTYAATVARRGDQTDANRLAVCIAQVIYSIITVPRDCTVEPEYLCEMVASTVSRCYKTSVSTHYIFKTLQENPISIRTKPFSKPA